MELNSDRKKILEKLNQMPPYVVRFIDLRERKMSPASLLGYLRDYECFFTFLLRELPELKGKNIKDIPLQLFETLEEDIIENYLKYLKYDLKRKPTTINRRISSLKSLFSFLIRTENKDTGQKFLQRNVMANIEFEDIKMTPAAKAENIRGKIFVSVDEVLDFLDFIATRYPKQISEKQKAYYERDFERDIAFISLILGTGMRVSEAISVTLDDLDLERQKIRIFRKGFKEDLIEFDDISKMYLKQYLSIRNERYKVPSKVRALFVRRSRQHGAVPLTKEAVQKIVEKYTKAYGRKNMSVHKLRHTFATLLWENTRNLPLVQEVLGHANSQTTVIYTHISNEIREKAVRGLYKQQKDN